MRTNLDQAKENLRTFGFTPIDPLLFAELLEDGAFDVDTTGHVACVECGVTTPPATIDDGVCGGCRWMSDMAGGVA